LPRGNQEELAAVVKAKRLDVKKTEQLVKLYRQAPTPEAKRFVVTHPLQALKQSMLLLPDQNKKLAPAIRQLLAGFGLVCRVSMKLQEIISHGLSMVDPATQMVLNDECEKAWAALTHVKENIGKT
jgi:hypothetical protein